MGLITLLYLYKYTLGCDLDKLKINETELS